MANVMDEWDESEYVSFKQKAVLVNYTFLINFLCSRLEKHSTLMLTIWFQVLVTRAVVFNRNL